MIRYTYQPEPHQRFTTKGKSMTESPAVPEVGSLLSIVKDLVQANRTAANEIVQNVLKSRVNVGKVVHELRNDEDTSDATIKAFQEWKEQASKAINDETTKVDAYIKANLVQTSAMSDEDFEVEKAKYKTLKTAQNDALKLAKGQPGYTEELFADLPALLSLSTGKESGSASSPTGIRRPGLEHITVNGAPCFTEKDTKDGTVQVFTFSGAAVFITKDSGVKVTASDLSDVAFKVVGSDNLSDATDVTFTHTVTDKDDVTHSYDIVAIPRNNEAAASETVAVEATVSE